MFSYIYMKILESSPARYDAGISWLSFGAADKIRAEIVERAVKPGDHVLDIGTGTGTMALLSAERGAKVIGRIRTTVDRHLSVHDGRCTNPRHGETTGLGSDPAGRYGASNGSG